MEYVEVYKEFQTMRFVRNDTYNVRSGLFGRPVLTNGKFFIIKWLKTSLL